MGGPKPARNPPVAFLEKSLIGHFVGRVSGGFAERPLVTVQTEGNNVRLKNNLEESFSLGCVE